MTRFSNYMKKCGFTLIEVMVMIILAGSVMVPIIGSMSNNGQRSVGIELRTAMENHAESTINKIVHDSVYRGEYPSNKTTTVNYPDPVSVDFDFQFTIEVEIKSMPDVTRVNAPSGTPPEGSQSSKFQVVAVTVSLVETDPAVEPVNLCTTIAIPPAPPDSVFVCAPTVNKIYEIDPISHVTYKEFNVSPAAPYFLAVHPSGSWLAIKAEHKIYIMDIRRDSNKYGQMCEIWAGGAAAGVGANSGVQATSSGSRLSRGLVFSEDGNSLYTVRFDGSGDVQAIRIHRTVTPDILYSTALDNLPPITNWIVDPLSSYLTPNQCMDIKLGQDGYVYYAIGSTVGAIRVNTHTNVIEDFTPTWVVEGQTNIDGSALSYRTFTQSWCGNEFAALFDGNGGTQTNLGFCLPYSPTETCFNNISLDESLNSTSPANGMLTTRDNVWTIVAAAANASAVKKRLHVFKRRPECDWINHFTSATVADQEVVDLATHDYLNIKHSPNLKEIIGQTTSHRVSFINTSNLISGTISPVEWAEPSSAQVTDVTGRIMEQVWLSCKGASTHSLECFDLYGGSTKGRFIQDNAIDTTSLGTPVYAGLTAGGDIADMVVNTGPSHVLRVANAIDSAMDTYTADFRVTALDWPSNFSPLKTVRLLDRSLAVIGKNTTSPAFENPIVTDVKAIADLDTCNFNGFLLYGANSDGKLAGGNPDLNFYASRNGVSGFQVKDIVAMHRRNGAYVLMTKTSATAESILLWVEKSKVGGYGDPSTFNTDQWRIMYFWRTKYDGFPEGQPTKMALSPDDTMLALYDPQGNGTNQCVRIYDMNNQHFPMRPGLGMVRYDDVDMSGFGTNISDSAPVLTSDDLKNEFFTDFSNLPVVKKNFPGTGHANDSTTNDTYRYFGQWYPSLTSSVIKSLTTAFGDGYRPFLNGMEQTPSFGDTSKHWNDGLSYYEIGYDLTAWSANPPDAVSVQFEAADANSSTEYSVACRSDSAAAANSTSTSGNDITSPRYRQLDGSGNDLHYIHRKHTRALRFRPMQIGADMIFNTSFTQLPNMTTGDGDKCIIRFNRNMASPTLLILNQAHRYLNIKDLFGIDSGFADYTNLENLSPDVISTTDFTDMQISPDGRRLLLCCYTPTKPNKLFSFDMTNPTLASFTEVDIPGGKIPQSIAVRDFNGYCTTPPNTTPVVVGCTNVGSPPEKSCGIQRATMGPGGIYFGTGSNGFWGVEQSSFYKFDPMASICSAKASLTLGNERRHSVLVTYDDKIYMFSGYKAALKNEVFVYDPVLNSWDEANYQGRNENNNSPVNGDCHGGSLTPLGILITGGVGGTDSNKSLYLYMPECYTGLVGNKGESINLNPLLADSHLHHGIFAGALVTHHSRRYKSWHSILCMGTAGGPGGTPESHGMQYYDYFENADSTVVGAKFGQNQHCYNGFEGNWQNMTMRTAAGACAWGDEVFLFGGTTGGMGTQVDTITAFNPDRYNIRSAGTMPSPIAFTSAVPCGPFIYLFQGDNSPYDSVCDSGTTSIWRYKP